MITGAEALVRWSSPDRGLVYPKQFVPIAEESGLIVDIGSWVIRRVCEQMRRWLDEAQIRQNVSVNDVLGQEDVEARSGVALAHAQAARLFLGSDQLG